MKSGQSGRSFYVPGRALPGVPMRPIRGSAFNVAKQAAAMPRNSALIRSSCVKTCQYCSAISRAWGHLLFYGSACPSYLGVACSNARLAPTPTPSSNNPQSALAHAPQREYTVGGLGSGTKPSITPWR
jgi:hypothetical protein